MICPKCGCIGITVNQLVPDAIDFCGKERPTRKVMCQLIKGHEGSHRAIIFWEDEKTVQHDSEWGSKEEGDGCR